MEQFRRIVALAGVAVFATVSAGCSRSNANSTTLGFVGTLAINQLLSQKIHHIFVIQQESHTFDNYFGTFPNANGFAQASASALAQPDPLNAASINKLVEMVFNLPTTARR